jgi:hypothetical protein
MAYVKLSRPARCRDERKANGCSLSAPGQMAATSNTQAAPVARPNFIFALSRRKQEFEPPRERQ